MVARTAATRKAKGKRLEKEIAALYREYKIDESARPMPLSGAMAHFKSDIYKKTDYEWVDEAKNHESINLRRFWDQTVIQAPMRTPVLHISGNYRPIITVLRQADFEAICPDERRYDIVDIMAKKRWSFWDHAKLCTDLHPTGTVIYCTVPDDSLVLMTAKSYFMLRREDMLQSQK